MGKDSRFLDNLSSPQVDENFKRAGVLIDAVVALIGKVTGEIAFPVYFNSNGGSAVNPQYVLVGGKVTEPSDPTKSGYVFDAWYTDVELTTPYDFDEEVTDEELGFTLYAGWFELFNLAVTDTNCTIVVSRGETPVDAGSDKVIDGESLVVTCTADADYEITSILVNDVAIASGDTIVVSGNVTIVATAAQLFDLSVTATHATVVVKDAANVTITAGSNKVVVGETLTITATPEAGYTLTTFTVNTVAETSPKTFVVTAANVVIVATGTQ